MRFGRRHATKKKRETALKRRVSNAEILILLYLLMAGLVLTLVLGWVLVAMNRLYTRATDASTLVLNPAPISFYMLGGFIGFCIAALTCERVHQSLLGPRPEFVSVEYIMAEGPLPGFVKKPGIGILVLFSLVAILNIRKHAQIGSGEIIEQRALDLGVESYAMHLAHFHGYYKA
jgi:hypothetical protein